jgi:UDP-N-acetyl-D-mannosaminuronic acid dehydrogenase
MPGPGVGGHCIAVDPWFIVEKQPETAKIIHLARKTNDSMPHYVLEKIKALTKDVKGTRKICVLGVTYKPNVDDMRESPVIELVHLLKEQGGFETIVVDHHVNFEGSGDRDVYEAVKGAHLVLLAVNHSEFKDLDFVRIKKAMELPQVLDTRHFWDVDAVEQAGLDYHLLGWGRDRA